MRKLGYFLILIVFLIFFNNFKDYNFKISIYLENLSAKEIDENIALNIYQKFLEDKKIKKFEIISSHEFCNIYLKTDKINFLNSIEIVKSKLKNFKYEIDYDFSYNEKYNCFVLIKLNDNYNFSKKIQDEILFLIFDNKITKKIKEYKNPKKAIYIYLDENKQKEFDLDTSEIKDLIQSNFMKFNSTKKENLIINSNSKISNINDIKNIKVNYKNKIFQTDLGEIFEIKYGFKRNFQAKILKNNQECILLCLKINPIFYLFQYIKLKIILKKYNDFIYISPTFFKIPLKFSNENFEKLKRKLENTNIIYFYNVDIPKISSLNPFEEENTQTTTILINIFDLVRNFDILKIKNNYTNSISQVKYILDFSTIADYCLKREEIEDLIKIQNEGLKLENFYMGKDRVDVILKKSAENSTKEIFLFLKSTNSFLPLSDFYEIETKKIQNKIIRKL